MKIIFFGSSNYCLPILQILNDKFQLTTIVTKQNSSVFQYAHQNNIQVFTPKDTNELSGLKDQINKLQPNLAIVADYGLLIPKEIFTIPRYKTLNIHFSKLPKLRGPSPVQYTILLGEKSAWISVIIMDEGIDTGDIIWQKEIKTINNQQLTINKETSQSLYIKLFNIIATDLPSIIKKYINNDPPAGGKPQKQDHLKATYTRHLTREDGYIPVQTLAAALKGGIESVSVERKIRSFTPWPGVWTEVTLRHPRGGRLEQSGSHDSPGVEESEQRHTKRLKLLKAHLETDPIPDRKAKTIRDRKARLILDQVQLEGKKPVSWKQFLEGYPDFSF